MESWLGFCVMNRWIESVRNCWGLQLQLLCCFLGHLWKKDDKLSWWIAGIFFSVGGKNHHLTRCCCSFTLLRLSPSISDSLWEGYLKPFVPLTSFAVLSSFDMSVSSIALWAWAGGVRFSFCGSYIHLCYAFLHSYKPSCSSPSHQIFLLIQACGLFHFAVARLKSTCPTVKLHKKLSMSLQSVST